MNAETWEIALQLLSVQSFFSRTVEDIRRGKNVIILHPYGNNFSEISDTIYDYIFNDKILREYVVQVVDVTTIDYAPTNLMELSKLVYPNESDSNVEKPSSEYLFNKFPRVTVFNKIHLLKPNQQLTWVKLIKSWADNTDQIRDKDGSYCTFCLVEPANNLIGILPESNNNISWRYWWGFPSSLELRLLCREKRLRDEVKTVWFEAVTAGVASGDLLLADTILESFPKRLDEVNELLNKNTTEKCPPLELNIRPSQSYNANLLDQTVGVPASLRNDWAKGRILASYDYGIEWHPITLAQNNNFQQLEHRMWRGQASILLPLVDQVRLSASSSLVRMYGEKWFTRWFEPQDPENTIRLNGNPLDAELGFLRALQNGKNVFRDSQWKNVLDTTWEIRNKLAHYEPLDWERFRAFWGYHNYQ